MVTSRIWFTAAQKAELWERWKNGQSAAAISRALERKNKTGVERIVVLDGGIVPALSVRSVTSRCGRCWGHSRHQRVGSKTSVLTRSRRRRLSSGQFAAFQSYAPTPCMSRKRQSLSPPFAIKCGVPGAILSLVPAERFLAVASRPRVEIERIPSSTK
jgi:hypothetical protein